MYVIFILNIQKSLFQTPQIEHCSYPNLNTARRGFDYQTSLKIRIWLSKLPNVYYSMVLLHPVTVQVQVLYHGTPPKIVCNLNDTFCLLDSDYKLCKQTTERMWKWFSLLLKWESNLINYCSNTNCFKFAIKSNYSHIFMLLCYLFI